MPLPLATASPSPPKTRLARAVRCAHPPPSRAVLCTAVCTDYSGAAGSGDWRGIFDRKAVSAAVQFVRERCRWEDHDRYEREIPHGNSLAFACLVLMFCTTINTALESSNSFISALVPEDDFLIVFRQTLKKETNETKCILPKFVLLENCDYYFDGTLITVQHVVSHS